MFKKASRLKFRFATPQGQVNVEDLWELPLTSNTGKANLDDIARGLNKQLKSGDDVSFVNKDKKSDEQIQMKFDIVKTIIDTRLAENEAAAKKKANKEYQQQIMSIIAQKEVAALGEKSIDELRKIAESMTA